MLTNEYLYGKDIDIPPLDIVVLQQRIELLKTNLSILLDHSYHIRDNKRVSDVLKAIDFYEDLKKLQ